MAGCDDSCRRRSPSGRGGRCAHGWLNPGSLSVETSALLHGDLVLASRLLLGVHSVAVLRVGREPLLHAAVDDLLVLALVHIDACLSLLRGPFAIGRPCRSIVASLACAISGDGHSTYENVQG